MQLGSSGLRALKGGALFHNPPQTRSIHVSPLARPSTAQSGSAVHTLFKQTRTLLSRFVSHLTTPGQLRAPGVPTVARSLYHGPSHPPTIHQGLSLPARYALGRPLGAPHLPRAPAVPRSTTQVGLGLARNFSTGRPVFQNLVENVPVSGRALWEADWEVNMNKERERLRVQRYGKKQELKARKEEMQQPRAVQKALFETTEDSGAEMNVYFPTVVTPEVTTRLLIPLAPTPTSRVPLSVCPPVTSAEHPLLPLPLLGSIHAEHGTHALRVSSLFARLDAARVFDEHGVRCSAHGDPRGLCTLLEVVFEGWDEPRVRGVLGEAGRGWCVLEEVRLGQDAEERARMDEMLETMSDVSGEDVLGLEDHNGPWHDPAQSVVFPTLDLSASFSAIHDSWSAPSPPDVLLLAQSGMSTPLDDLQFHNAWSTIERDLDRRHDSDVDSDIFPEVGSDFSVVNSVVDASWIEAANPNYSPGLMIPGQSSTSESWSGFGERMSETERPTGYLF